MIPPQFRPGPEVGFQKILVEQQPDLVLWFTQENLGLIMATLRENPAKS